MSDLQPRTPLEWVSNYAENMLAGLLGLVPEVGSMLSAMVYVLWPQPNNNVFAEIEDQVQTLIHADLDVQVWNNAQTSLTGLRSVANNYVATVQTGDPSAISSTWISANTVFLDNMPQFQAQNNQFLLLPSFVQVANMHLALLRDGALFGAGWGWTSSYQQKVNADLVQAISDYLNYATTTYNTEYQKIVSSTASNAGACQPFRTVNNFVRQMTFMCLDFTVQWPYYDINKYPDGAQVYLSREIYSDPVGSCTDSGNIVLPSPPTQPISQLTVWGWDRIDAVQLTYPAGGGPGGVTTTARQGDQSGGSNQPPHGGIFNIAADNPIVLAGGLFGSILNAFIFNFQDGTTTGLLGGNYPGGSSINFSYPGEILSSIHINGVSNYYKSADSAVFGFKYQQTDTVSVAFCRTLYITSPTEPQLDNMAQKVAPKKLDSAQVRTQAASENWAALRQAYWSQLENS